MGTNQVFMIVENSGKIQFIMARFEKVKDKEKERKLLYPLMKYAVDCTKDEFLFDAIYGEDVICPCCCIPAGSRS